MELILTNNFKEIKNSNLYQLLVFPINFTKQKVKLEFIS